MGIRGFLRMLVRAIFKPFPPKFSWPFAGRRGVLGNSSRAKYPQVSLSRHSHAVLVVTAIAATASTLEAAVDKDAIGDATPSAALAVDDECLSPDGSCALNALQHKK